MLESNFSSRTVTEQSIYQSFTSDANMSYAFNVPDNISKHNAPSLTDLSNANLESININQEKGHTRLSNFSFVCEPDQEHEIRKQIELYLKIKRSKKRNFGGSKSKHSSIFIVLVIDKPQIFELSLNSQTIDRRFSEYKKSKDKDSKDLGQINSRNDKAPEFMMTMLEDKSKMYEENPEILKYDASRSKFLSF